MSVPAYPATQPITPARGPLDAVVTVPGSKSITNRALLVAALAEGRSVLDGVLDADDTAAMIDCLRRLGVGVVLDTDAERATVDGVGGRWPALAIPDRMVWLDARQSGTTARFLPPALALAAGSCTLDGAEQLRARPFGPLVAALRSLGVAVDGATGERLPLVVHGGSRARWAAEVAISGDVSSQFLSGLMMAAPLAPHGLRIALTTPLVSVPYVTMTAQVMAAFGAAATVGDGVVEVPPGRYEPRAHRVEGDASAASYFFAAAAICGGTVRVRGLGRHSCQGDAAFADVLATMGCTVRRGEDWTEVGGPPPGAGGLRGVTVDLADLSDTAPTLAVVAPFAATPTTMTGIGFIRRKESDRIGAVVRELRRLGIDADEDDDGMTVHPAGPASRGTTVATYDDHRLAMSFAVAGLRLAGTVVDDPGCVAKTFPRFWDVFGALQR